MSTINIDSLLESALAKDKSRLPEQPLIPDASLLEKLSANPAASAAVTATTTSIGGIAISKVSMIVLAALSVGTAAYFYFQSPEQAPLQKSITPQTRESTIIPAADSNTVLSTPAKKKTSDSLKAIVKKDSAIAPAPVSMEDNFISPKTPPKNYSVDSTKVPIRTK